MIKLRINNSESQIEGLTREQFSKLRDILSYKLSPQEEFYAGGFSRRIRLMDRKGRFPTGLLYLVEKFLDCCPTPTQRIDARRAPRGLESTIGTSGIPNQRPPAKIDLNASEAYFDKIARVHQREAADAARRERRGIIVAPTGSGKSMIIAMIISRLKVRTLIVVPTLELKRQLTSTLRETYGDLVGEFGSTLAVENIDALSPDVQADYGCLIIDEFHRSASDSYQKLNMKSWNGIYYRFGLTATPFRTNDNENILLEAILSKVIYELSYTTAVESKYIVPMEAYYIEVPKCNLKGDGKRWASVYSQLVVNNECRNAIISNLLLKFHAKEFVSLCLIKEIKHGRILSDLTGAAFANGVDQDSKDFISWFNKGQLKTLVGTTGVIGEGVDTKPTEFVIIAGLGKSRSAFMQQCGRGFRNWPGKESCKIIIFKDMSHKWTIRHFNAQYKILQEEYGVTPVKLEI